MNAPSGAGSVRWVGALFWTHAAAGAAAAAAWRRCVREEDSSSRSAERSVHAGEPPPPQRQSWKDQRRCSVMPHSCRLFSLFHSHRRRRRRVGCQPRPERARSTQSPAVRHRHLGLGVLIPRPRRPSMSGGGRPRAGGCSPADNPSGHVFTGKHTSAQKQAAPRGPALLVNRTESGEPAPHGRQRRLLEEALLEE